MLSDITLRHSRDTRLVLRKCCKCGATRSTEGGIELKPGEFTCRGCWRRSAISASRKKK